MLIFNFLDHKYKHFQFIMLLQINKIYFIIIFNMELVILNFLFPIIVL